MDELLILKGKIEELLADINDNTGGERIQPYICVLEGLLKGITADLSSDC